jgi:hypothetical protein
LRAGEVFPLDEDVFLVAACFVDDKNLDGGEWRQLVADVMTDMLNGKWEEKRNKVRQLRKDMTNAGFGDVNITKLSACPSSVYATLGGGDVLRVFDRTPKTLCFHMGTGMPAGQIRFVACTQV